MAEVTLVAKTMPLVLGISLLLSACAESEYGTPAYTPPEPVYGTSELGSSGWSGWHNGWARDHDYIGE
jgi:hypothetical protein